MSWQDIGLTVGGLLFTLALIPTLIGAMKPPIVTALMTGTLLCFFGVIYLSLGLEFAAVSIMVNGTVWLIIAAQVWRRR